MTNNDLPLFPLGTVLFPDGRMKLRIFEPRYVNLVKHCMKSGEGFGIVAIAKGNEAGRPAEPFDTGVEVSIIDFDQLPDGLLGVTVQAKQRFDIVHRWIDSENLQHAEVNYRAPFPDIDLPESLDDLSSILAGVFPELQKEYGYEKPYYNNAAWVLGRLVEVLPMPLSYKVELLQWGNPVDALSDLQQRLQRADQQSASRHF